MNNGSNMISFEDFREIPYLYSIVNKKLPVIQLIILIIIPYS